MALKAKALDLSREVLSVQSLKDYQIQALIGLLEGRDIVLSQPTGSGKSLVYQLAPYVFDFYNILTDGKLNAGEREAKITNILQNKKTKSIVIVIQPLISLMKDQIIGLQRKGISVCRLMHASEKELQTGPNKKGEVLNKIKGCSIILTSPEAILETHRSILREPEIRGRVVCVAVDEGHCIVKWGSNSKNTKAFREDYSKLAELHSLVTCSTRIPFVSLTATALPSVEKAIITNLQMQSILRIVKTPDRQNIRYVILKLAKDDSTMTFKWIIDEISEHGHKSSRVLIFCQSHKHCRTLFRLFDIHFKKIYSDHTTRPFAMFHAGTDNEVKDHIIKSMGCEDGKVRVVFATTAFGMGIYCKSLHLVVHYGPPSDVDDYVQESGRVGRDGPSSNAVLVFFPRCTSAKTSPAMKLYTKNADVCRRQILFRYFGHNADTIPLVGHACCDICFSSCKCQLCKDSCGDQFLSPIEKFFQQGLIEEATGEQSPELMLSDTGKDLLTAELTSMRNEKVLACTNSIVGNDIITGFPLSAINEIVSKVNIMSNENVIWQQTSLLDKQLIKEIFRIVEELRSHHLVPNLDIQKQNEIKDSHKSEDSDITDAEASDSNSNTDDSDEVISRQVKYRANYRLESDDETDTD